MNKKTALTFFFFSLSLKYVFANHGVDAMGDGLALLFLIGFVAIVISITSVILSYRAYKKNKTSLKIVATILTIPLGILLIILIKIDVFGGLSFIPLPIIIVNMLLITNAKTPVEIADSNPNDLP